MPLARVRAASNARPASLTWSVEPNADFGPSFPVPGPSSRPKRRTTPRRPDLGEAFCLLLGDQSRAQDRRYVAERRLFGHGAVPGVDERHGGLDIYGHPGRERGIDQDCRGFRAQPVVLAPFLGLLEEVKRPDAGRKVQHGVGVVHGGGDCGGVEQVEFGPCGSVQVMPCRIRQRPQRAAQDSGSTGDQEAHR